MSAKKKELTFKFVRDYKKKNANLQRRTIRRLIMLELKIPQRSSEERRLERYLQELFDAERQRLKQIEELKRKAENLEKYEWVAAYLRLSELLEDDEDYQLLYDLLEKLEQKQEAKAWREDMEFQAEVTKENPTPKLSEDEKKRLKEKLK